MIINLLLIQTAELVAGSLLVLGLALLAGIAIVVTWLLLTLVLVVLKQSS